MKLTDELLEQHAAKARDLWLSTLPQQEEVPPHKFSRRFERKMRRLRAEQRRSPRMNRVVHILRYVAACAAVVLCIGGTAYAYRIGVLIRLFRCSANTRPSRILPRPPPRMQNFRKAPSATFRRVWYGMKMSVWRKKVILDRLHIKGTIKPNFILMK